MLYKRNSSKNLVGYSNADWGGDCDNYKSTSGYCFQVGGTVVSWRSKKQSCVALSTAEAEYMALTSTAPEAIWLTELCKDLKNDLMGPTMIIEDNQSAICMAKNPNSMVEPNKLSLHLGTSQQQKRGIEVLSN